MVVLWPLAKTVWAVPVPSGAAPEAVIATLTVKLVPPVILKSAPTSPFVLLLFAPPGVPPVRTTEPVPVRVRTNVLVTVGEPTPVIPDVNVVVLVYVMEFVVLLA